jgi:Tfp pilus assembly protein PilF
MNRALAAGALERAQEDYNRALDMEPMQAQHVLERAQEDYNRALELDLSPSKVNTARANNGVKVSHARTTLHRTADIYLFTAGMV